MTIGDILEAATEADAVETLHRLGCTDGLPVIVPTEERVASMVLATGYDGDLSLGSMGPNQGAATIEKIAAAAVMAGCLADHMPVVLAAARCVLDPRFDVTEMQATTHAIAPLVIVNGPARRWCGPLHGGFGALGPGHRANASIGRALRLAMINIGGGRSGSSDMSLMGQPGKFTMCLAEDEEKSPFEPMHTLLGYGADDSVVTVLGVDGPQSVIGVADADDPTTPDRLLRSIALGFANVTTNNAALRGGQAAVALNPDHAALLADAGYDLAAVRAGIVERAIVDGRDLVASAARMGALDPERTYPCFKAEEDLLVFVAGGGGLYSTVFPSWCAGPHRNRAVTLPIEVGQSCEIPAFATLAQT